ncbi:MAG: glycosyl hydrolase family 17 [Planctomycetota bacterium]
MPDRFSAVQAIAAGSILLVPSLAASPALAQPADQRPLVTHIDGNWIGEAISYGPFRDGQGPDGASPSDAELLEDLQILAERWRLIRMYGSVGSTEAVCRLIVEHELPLQVMVGAWIDAEFVRNDNGSFGDQIPEVAAANRAEVETAIRLANLFPTVVHSINVGNESQVFWSWHRSPRETLIGYLRQAREGTTVPITTCDDYNFWNRPESQAVADEVDFIGWHAYPMWNGQTLADSMSWIREKLAEVHQMHPDHPIVHAEVGWATRKHTEGEQATLVVGEPGEKQQELFYRTYTAWANENGLPHFYFSAFDENWKGGPHPDEIEKHWGLYRADRTPKLAVQRTPAEGRGR